MKKNLHKIFLFSFLLFAAIVFCEKGFAQPANDNCASATALVENAASTSGTSASATTEVGENTPTCGVLKQSVWYKFTAINTSMTVSINKTGGACTADAAAFSGTCFSFTQIGQNCGISSGSNPNLINLSSLIIGNTYYIVTEYNNGGPCGANWTWDIQVTGTCAVPTISPALTYVCSGGSTVLTASSGYATYQWQSSSDNITFTNIAGATSSAYTTPALASTTYYRVNYTLSTCSGTTSSVVVNVVSAPVITTQPANTQVCVGSNTVLSISAGPASSTYQWQYWNGSVWANVANGTPANFTYTNPTTANLTVATTTAATPGTYTYRCNVTACASTVSSSSAVLTVNAIPVAGSVSASPNSGAINCATGAGLSTTITLAGGYTGTIQWQSSSDNSTWNDIYGATASTYATTVSATEYFRTVQTSTNGCTATQASSAVVTITGTSGTRTASVSGNWSSTATWGGASVPTLCYDVIINSGVTVTADLATANINCHNLTITSGGQITLNRQNGRFLSVYGNLINNSNGNGNTLGGIQQDVASTASGQGNSSGLQLMGTGTVWGGTNNANYDLLTLRVGDGSNTYLTADATIDMIDATKTSTAGNISLGNKTFKITHSFFNSGSSVHVNTGYLWLQLTSSMSIDQTALYPDYGTVFDDLAGNWIISGSWNTIGGTGWYNLEIRNSTAGSKAEYASSHVCRNKLTIDAGAGTVRFGSCDFGAPSCNGVPAPPYTVSVAGDFTNNGTTNITTDATFIMNGTAAQSMNGSTVTQFSYLQINNTSSTGVTLNQDEEVGVAASPYGGLTLTDGYLYTSTTNLLTVNNNATSTSGSAASFVNGPMKKLGNQAFVFPVGQVVSGTGWWRRIEMVTAPAAATSSFQAKYVHAGYGVYTACGSPTPVLTDVSKHEYWILDKLVADASSPQVKLYWEDAAASGLNPITITDLRVSHYNAGSSCWENNNDATTSTGSTSGSSPGTIATTAGVATFSPFTIGTKGPTPLPVDLLSFTADCSGDKVIANWQTATEMNSDYFTLEKSTDGSNFYTVKKVKAAGNSSTVINYSAEDVEPYSAASYYRLSETDFNGQTKTFDMIPVKGCGNDNITAFSSGNMVTLLINSKEDNNYNIVLMDAQGKVVLNKKEFFAAGNNKATFTVNADNGIYFLKVFNDKNIRVQKLSIQR